ncbi:MAG: energy transducer TonB [Saprospiraceae bacterium]|nr:energy transducer TonB [Saprospiraceae bacterium]
MFHSDDARFLHLLQKWQDGDFTRRDEQELQALVRDDAFRREAWEGFQEHPEVDHNVRLNALRARLRPEQRRRRVWLPQAMAAAAVFVVLLAALWFFRGPAPEPVDTLAKTETPTLQTETMSDATATPAAEVPQALRKSVEPIAKADKAIRQEEGAGTVFSDAVSEKKQQDEIVATDDKQAPAVVYSAAEEAESTKESKDLGDLATAPPAPASRPPAEVEQMSTRAKTAAKPQATAPGQPASQANAMQEVDYNLLGLQDYLHRNARLPEAARQNNISGFVKVSFDLDKKRRPKNFQILQTLGYGCDEEALRLLKAYNFSQFTQDTLTVEVPFVR